MTSKQLTIAGAVIVVAAVVAFFATRGPGVGNQGTEGTIGTANRYQSEQIDAQGVSLEQPEVASFVQSDAFRKLATNAEFQKLLDDNAFKTLVGQEGIRREIAAGRLTQDLSDAGLTALLDNATFREVAGKGSLTELMKHADLARLSESGFSKLLENRSFIDLARKADFQKFAEAARDLEPARRNTEGFRELAARFETLMKAEAFTSLLESRNLPALTEAGFFNLFADANLASQVTDQAFMDLFKMDAFKTDLGNEGIRNVMEGLSNPALIDAARTMGRNTDAMSVFQMDAFKEVAMKTEFASLASADMLKEAAAKASLD